MADRTSAGTDVEILAADGATWIPLVLYPPDPVSKDDPALKTLQEVLAASEADAPVSETLKPAIYEDWLPGIGLAYNAAPGVYTRSGGYALPAGAMTQVQAVAVGNGGPVVAWEELGTDLFYAQQGTPTIAGKVCRSIGGTGVLAGAFAASLTLTVGEYIQGLCLFDNGAGTTVMWASSSDLAGLNGRLHKWDGAAWTSTAAATFGTNGRGRMKVVNWTTQDGATATRLVTVSGRNKISYTIPDADPALAPSWVEGVPIGTMYTILEIVGAESHLYFSAQDGLFDLNEQGRSPNLVSRSAFSAHLLNGMAVEYLDGFVYQTIGNGGLHRIRVDQHGVIQEQPGVCGPGWGTPAESEWLAGYPSAFAVDSGCIIAAYFNPTTQRAALFYGRDRNVVGIQTPNPLVWWGPEYTLNAPYRVNRMRISSQAGDRRLWIAAQSVTGSQVVIVWASLPDAGAPIDDLISGGQMRFNSHTGSGLFNPFCSLETMPEGSDDRSALKIVNETTYTTRGLSKQTQANGSVVDDGLGTKLTVYDRAVDTLAPSSTSWGAGTDVTTGPITTVPPSSAVQGHRLQTRIDFVNPSGRATPAAVGVLDACRRTVWPIVPSFSVRVLNIEYGDDVLMHDNAAWSNLGIAPDDVSDALLDLTRFGRTTMRDPWGNTAVVKVHQVLSRVETITHGETGKHVRASIRATVLAS